MEEYENMRIVYICTGNSFRSPVAEALTKKYKPSIEVSSAGTSPASRIAGSARSLLEEEEALTYAKEKPEPVNDRILDSADSVIVMEEDHSDYIFDRVSVSSNKVENWDIADPINPEVKNRLAFDQIKNKVKSL